MTEAPATAYLMQLIDKLETAQFTPDQVAIALDQSIAIQLKWEVQRSTGIYCQSVHHAEYNGWRLIVKGEK